MVSKGSLPGGKADVRQMAEKILSARTGECSDNLAAVSPKEADRLIHQLRVHQIELELQNEELRRAQVELDGVKSIYFDLYDQAPIGYCTITAKGLIKEANLTAATLLGVARGEIIGQPMSRFILSEDKDIYYNHFKQLFGSNEPHVCRLRLVRPASPPFWARLQATVVAEHESGSPLCRLVLSDISESMRTEEALAESEQRYRTLANSGQALIWTSGLDKQCDYFNQPWLDFTGRTIEQERGNGWLQGVHPEDLDHCLLTYTTAFDRQKSFSMEYRLLHVSGTYRWIQDDGSPRFDGQGNFQGYIGHCLDITAYKQAKEEQDTLQAQLFHSQKIESVGRLAGGGGTRFQQHARRYPRLCGDGPGRTWSKPPSLSPHGTNP